MFYCEECRIKNKLRVPPHRPYHNHLTVDCELCSKRKDCYDYPAIYAKPKESWTSEEKLLDSRLQGEYHSKAESLIIAYVKGPRAGAIDQAMTDHMKQAFINDSYYSDGIDWYATYELRVKFQEAVSKIEFRK